MHVVVVATDGGKLLTRKWIARQIKIGQETTGVEVSVLSIMLIKDDKEIKSGA